MPQIKIIDPLQYPNWDSLLLSSTGYSFFHSLGWARVLCESYRFKPLYFIQLSQDRLSALLPLMEAHTFLLGRKGISLPFSDHCFPIASNGSHLDRIVREAISYGKQARWKYVEFRGDNAQTEHAPPYSSYYHHTLNLSRDQEDMMSKFRANTRRNRRQAIKKKSMLAFSTPSTRSNNFTDSTA
jgi:hypothetical protein